MDERTCEHCGEAPARRLYCSDQCKVRARDARRYRAQREKIKARHLANYYRRSGSQPFPPTERTCSHCRETFTAMRRSQVYCSTVCRKRADNERQRVATGKPEPMILRAVSRGQVVSVKARLVPPAGLMAWCPLCGVGAGVLGDDLAARWCPICDEAFRLNEEEVAWVTCAPPSTAQSKPAA